MKAVLLSLPLLLAAAAPKPAAKGMTSVKPRAWSPKLTTAGKLSSQELRFSKQLKAIAPLSRAKLLKAAKIAGGATVRVDEPHVFSLSPRAPVHGAAFMNVVGGNVWVAPSGRLDVPPAAVVGGAANATAFNKYVEVSFPTQAGYAYMLDCQTTANRHEVIRNWQGDTHSSINVTDGHLLVPLSTVTRGSRATFQIASTSVFSLSSCDVVPLRPQS